ncbi:aspartic peptidase domain-containing protein [Mycena vulgaris]|nr:aspartic peptidase domain-containing protein [Mycena vulgaris]
MLLPASLLTFVLLGDFACALRLNIEGRRIPADRRGLSRRGSLAGSSPLDNSADLQYIANITVGGASFEVLIDTGSADLWVAGSVAAGSATGKAATISYASGGATGPVKTAPVEFGGYTVPKQAFMEVVPDSDHPIGQGLIGLGPSSGSNIFAAFDSEDEGNTVLDSLFIQNTSTPNFITFLLGRLNDPTDVFPGDITVGELLPNYTDVTNQPKLPVTDVSISNRANQHFQILLDANGFIGPDGSSIPISSQVSSTSNRKQATVVIDTGFSLPQVPSSVAKAVYSRFDGAELVKDPSLGNVWIVPCTQEVNVTLKFGGKAYPVHPLDTTIDPKIFNLAPRKNSKGVNSCIGLFQPISFDVGDHPTYDIIFGMAFLRNVYTLINFGDYIADSKNKGDPFIQFLSITEPREAHTDFVTSRLNGVDTTIDVFNPNNSNNNDFNSDNSSSSSKSKSKTIYYIVAASVVGVILLAILGAFIFKRSRSQRGVYRPLHVPAPAPMYGAGAQNPPMYQQGPMYQQPYGAPTYNPDRPYDPPQEHVPYHNPYEHRP